ncbi:ketosynthase chain-length factor [Actinomadura gamaensis]|uniref:Ketosynthase chain-length factor n=1 Tax=Actinomadura gamaensis TaxID=1763541 RepID=A0ABV9U3L8_9ACTN
MTAARAVVTGLGVAAPGGLGTGPYWRATLDGATAIGRITRFDPSGYPATLAGEVPPFDPGEHLPSRLVPQTDTVTRLALMAAGWAIDDAGLDLAALPDSGVGVVTASTSGGYEFSQRELQKLWGGEGKVSAYLSFAWFYAVNTGQISIRHNLRGPSGVLVNGQAGGLDALAHARRYVRDGLPAVVSGGMESALCPWGWVGHLSHRDISRGTDPARSYLPFDASASGFVPGEGGAILIVEDAAAARGRGAEPYGEIAGYGSTFDPPPASGRGPNLERAIRLALDDAALAPGDIDVVFADAAGVAAQDRAEAAALAAVFGPHGVPVTAPKTMTGRLYAGGAAVDVAAALLAMRDGVVPATVNVTDPVPGYRLDLVLGEPRRMPVRTALVVARGFDGFNSALILAAPGAAGREGAGQ